MRRCCTDYGKNCRQFFPLIPLSDQGINATIPPAKRLACKDSSFPAMFRSLTGKTKSEAMKISTKENCLTAGGTVSVNGTPIIRRIYAFLTRPPLQVNIRFPWIHASRVVMPIAAVGITSTNAANSPSLSGLRAINRQFFRCSSRQEI